VTLEKHVLRPFCDLASVSDHLGLQEKGQDHRERVLLGGMYAIHEMQHSKIGVGCDLRHFELCLPGVRWKNGKTRPGVHVPGGVSDGLASGLAACLGRVRDAIKERTQGSSAHQISQLTSPDAPGAGVDADCGNCASYAKTNQRSEHAPGA